MNISFSRPTYERLLSIAVKNDISIAALTNILLTRLLDNDSDNMMFYTRNWHQFSQNEGVWCDDPAQATFEQIITEYKNNTNK